MCIREISPRAVSVLHNRTHHREVGHLMTGSGTSLGMATAVVLAHVFNAYMHTLSFSFADLYCLFMD